MPRIIASLNLSLAVKQRLKPDGLLRVGYGIDHDQRRGVRPRRVLESEHAIVLDPCEKVHGLDKVLGRLAGKADDNVSRDRDWPPGSLDPRNPLQIPIRRVL